MAGFSKIAPRHANHLAEKDTPPPQGDLPVGNDRESGEWLKIPREQLAEGENKDPFCGSPQYPIHLELDVLCQDVVLRPPSKSQTSTKTP
jgi:hypothetical protein